MSNITLVKESLRHFINNTPYEGNEIYMNECIEKFELLEVSERYARKHACKNNININHVNNQLSDLALDCLKQLRIVNKKIKVYNEKSITSYS